MIQAESILDLVKGFEGRRLTYRGAGWETGSIVLLSLPHTLYPEPLRHYRVHYRSQSWSADLDLAPTTAWYSFAQPIGLLGKWLLVRSKTRGVEDANAAIFTDKGELRRTFHVGGVNCSGHGDLGDGIRDVQATSLQTMDFWIAYDLAGEIHESKEWRQPGLACFSEAGQLYLDFNQNFGRDVPSIYESYALNVTGKNNAWVYYKSSSNTMLLVNINRPKRTGQVWNVPINSAFAFAVDGKRALFSGSYDNTNSLCLLDLRNPDRAEPIHVHDSDGDSLPTYGTRFARGPYLYLSDANEQMLYRVDIRKL